MKFLFFLGFLTLLRPALAEEQVQKYPKSDHLPNNLFWRWTNRALELSSNQIESGTSKWILNANWLRERSLTDGYVDKDSLQPLIDPHDVGNVEIKSIVVGDLGESIVSNGKEEYDSSESKSEETITNPFKYLDESSNSTSLLTVKFSDGQQFSYDVREILFELQNERHTCTQNKDTTCVYPNVFLWSGKDLVHPNIIDYNILQASEKMTRKDKNSPSEYGQLVHQLLTTGLILIDNVPKKEGFCKTFFLVQIVTVEFKDFLITNCNLLLRQPQQVVQLFLQLGTSFGSKISTVRFTEWGSTFNVRTIPDVQEDVNDKQDADTTTGEKKDAVVLGEKKVKSVTKKDLAYTAHGTVFFLIIVGLK